MTKSTEYIKDNKNVVINQRIAILCYAEFGTFGENAHYVGAMKKIRHIKLIIVVIPASSINNCNA